MKCKKLFNRALWCLLTGFFAVWFLIALIGKDYAVKNSSTINNLLGINPNKVVGETAPEKMFKSDYVKKDEDGNEKYDDLAMRANSEKIAEQVAADGSVLLWNNDSALPLAADSRISLFGIGSVVFKHSGGGSGEISSSPSNNLKSELEILVKDGGAGFKVNGTLFNAYTQLRTSSYGALNYQGKKTKDPNYNGTNGYLDERYREFEVREVPWSKLDSTVSGGVERTLKDGKNTKGYGDAAVMIITRDGAEDGDTYFKTNECLDGSYLDLSKEESEVLTKLKELKQAGTVKKVIVVLNTASTMQMMNLTNYDVDACLLVGCGGLKAFTAIADLLSGKANPSGRLVDVIAYDFDSIPAMQNFGDFRWTSSKNLPASDINSYNNFYLVYQEGVYVGYRYFETRYEDLVMNKGSASSAKGAVKSGSSWNYSKEVAFPFGYGLSYTTFSEKLSSVTYDKTTENYTLKVEVTNTGAKKGKTPVQVYLQKPYTEYDKKNGIEKPSVELVGFTKTGEIEPGKSETAEITVPASEFKVYDAYGKGTYLLEKGDYYLSVGSDSHAALNNVLALKGYSSKDGMVDSLGKATDGVKDNAYKITVAADDFTKYSKSVHTGVTVENQISDGDINLYSGTADQKTTYLSRSDWDKTYPAPIKLSCVNDTMVKDMQFEDYAVPASEGEMPTMGTVTVSEEFFNDVELAEGQEKRLNLAMMVGKEYDDELWSHLLNQLTWTEMNHLLSGGYLTVQGTPSVGSPGGIAADGTSGVRVKNPTTGDLMGFPTATVMAQTWDEKLIELLGDAFGQECMHAGVSELYAPCANMHRTPYGGRNWEYFSEDPFITGKMLAAESKGLQKRGVIVCAKHFAFNDQELNRCGVATFLNEQTAREIYLKGFELGVTEGKVKSLMSSFPRLGCKWEGHYDGLMTDILRKEWGFTGFVETDSAFGQPYMTKPLARIEGVICGVDFWMDGAASMQFAGYENNATVVRAVREACHRMLYAQTNSLIINGMTTSSIVVYETPWWVNAISYAQVALGTVTGLLLAMSVASFVVFALDNKKKEA